MRNKEDPYAQYAVKDKAANAQSMEDPYAQYAQEQQPQHEQEQLEQDQAEGIFNPKVREYLAKGGNPYMDKLRHMQDQSLKEYSKGFYPSAYESLANQSVALNNLIGSKLPYYHDLQKPGSEAEAEGQRVGPLASEFLPAAAGGGLAGLVERAPQEAALLAKIMRSGSRVGLGAAGGGAAGAATSENRAAGAVEGAKQGALAVAIPGTAKWLEERFGINPVTKAEQKLQDAIKKESEHKAALEQAQYEAKGAGYPMKHQEYPTKIENTQEAIQNALQELHGLPTEEYPGTVLHPAHTQLTPIAQEQYQQALQHTQEALRHGEPVDEQLGKLMADNFGNLETELKTEFKAIDKSMPDTLIHIQKPSEKEIQEEVNKYIGEEAHPDAKEAIRKEVTRYLTESGEKPISVRDAYRKFRSLEMELNEDKLSLGKHKQTPEEYQTKRGIIKAKEAEIAHLENLIKKHAPTNAFERLQTVKKRWRNEFVPVRFSPIYREAAEHHRISSQNLIDALRGKNAGNTLLRNWIQSNPEASVLTASMHYAEHPEQLMHLNQRQRQYINEKTTPDLMQRIQQQIEAHQNIQHAQAQQEHFAEQHARALQEAKEHAKQKQRANEIQEKELPNLLKKRADMVRLQEKIKTQLEKHNLSKEEVTANKEKLAKIQERSDRVSKQIKTIRNIIGGAVAYDMYHRKH